MRPGTVCLVRNASFPFHLLLCYTSSAYSSFMSPLSLSLLSVCAPGVQRCDTCLHPPCVKALSPKSTVSPYLFCQADLCVNTVAPFTMYLRGESRGRCETDDFFVSSLVAPEAFSLLAL